MCDEIAGVAFPGGASFASLPPVLESPPACLLAMLAGALLYFRGIDPSLGDKSIAVLPFKNLSNDPTNAFFAEGIQDDLLSRLVKIRDLKVISRHSAARYPGTLAEICEPLAGHWACGMSWKAACVGGATTCSSMSR